MESSPVVTPVSPMVVPKKGSERMWESIVLTVAATADNNIGNILQKKGTIILPPLSFKFKVTSRTPGANNVCITKLSIPEFARPNHDGLYRATDIYLKEHPYLTKAERKKICGLMDVKKFYLEALNTSILLDD